MGPESMDYKWYKDNSSLHGIPDLLGSWTACQRSVWSVAIVVALIATGCQLKGITEAFVSDKVGSLEEPYIPTRIPSVMICPTRIPIKDQVPNTTIHLGDEDKLYIKGYFVMTGSEIMENGTSKNPKVEKVLKNHYNGSLDAMLAGLVDEGKLHYHDPQTQPPIGTIQLSYVSNLYGPCFVARCDMEVTEKLSDYAEYRMTLKPESRKHDMPFHYRVFLGDADAVGLAPSPRDPIHMLSGFEYEVSVRVHQRNRYKGRRGNRCVDRTKSDTQHCQLMPESHRCLNGPSNCVFYIPRSTTQSAVETIGDNQTYCNAKRDGMIGCVTEFLFDPKLQRQVTGRCGQPCEAYAYDKTIRWMNRPDVQVGLRVNLDSLIFSKVTTEYPIMTTEDYLAAVGGTVGLFFGASVLSCVQILLCSWESAFAKVNRKRM